MNPANDISQPWPMQTFRYDLATLGSPRIILITDTIGKRSDIPLLGYVVLPSACYRGR